MDFFLIGVFLWGLIGVSILLFLAGLLKKSWKAYLWSGIAFLIPSLILYDQQGIFSWFVVLPLLAFLLAFFTKKRG